MDWPYPHVVRLQASFYKRLLVCGVGTEAPSFQRITPLEVGKAAGGLAAGKATGPDGFPVEVYNNMPGLWPLLAEMFTSIIEHGKIPDSWLQLYIIPLDKPGKDPRKCENKRPISLINAAVKILEAVALHRIQPGLGHRLPGAIRL